MVFPVVVYGCKSWTVKKAEHRRIDAFELWCWKRLLRVSWTAKRSNQSILKEISPEYLLEGLILKLKLQSFGPLMQTTDSLEKTLMLGKNWRQEKGMTEDEMSSLTQWTWVWVNSGSWWWTGRPGMLQSMGSQRVGHSWATELNWTALNFLLGWSQTRHMPCHLVKDNQDVVQICKQWVCCGCPSTQSWTYRGRERKSVQ